MWKNSIQPAIDASTDVHNLDDIFEDVSKEISTGKTGQLRKKELQKGLEALKDDYSDIDKDFSTQSLQSEKSSLDSFTPQKVFKGEDVANAYNQVKAMLADKMRKKVRDSLSKQGVNAAEAYRDWANLQELSKIGVK